MGGGTNLGEVRNFQRSGRRPDRNPGGGTKFLGDPAEGRITRMRLETARMERGMRRAKRGWAKKPTNEHFV